MDIGVKFKTGTAIGTGHNAGFCDLLVGQLVVHRRAKIQLLDPARNLSRALDGLHIAAVSRRPLAGDRPDQTAEQIRKYRKESGVQRGWFVRRSYYRILCMKRGVINRKAPWAGPSFRMIVISVKIGQSDRVIRRRMVLEFAAVLRAWRRRWQHREQLRQFAAPRSADNQPSWPWVQTMLSRDRCAVGHHAAQSRPWKTAPSPRRPRRYARHVPRAAAAKAARCGAGCSPHGPCSSGSPSAMPIPRPSPDGHPATAVASGH